QGVVEEAVLLVPERHLVRAEGVHRLGDGQEVLEELGRRAVPGLVEPGQLQRDLEHLLAVERHPAGRVRLLQPVAGRSNSAMLSMPRKPPSNRFDPAASLRLTHQEKFISSLVNTRTRNCWSR